VTRTKKKEVTGVRRLFGKRAITSGRKKGDRYNGGIKNRKKSSPEEASTEHPWSNDNSERIL
jgi:hypothetical protein